jgi:hypothetical protein
LCVCQLTDAAAAPDFHRVREMPGGSARTKSRFSMSPRGASLMWQPAVALRRRENHYAFHDSDLFPKGHARNASSLCRSQTAKAKFSEF